MKGQMDDNNYESMISKLAKGSIDQKSQSLKKLLFLYENARSRIYLYERRITQSLELSLLIEEKDISLNALNLLERIIMNTSAESEIMNIIKKRLLSKIILNLGSIEMAIRKISHKCILEYVRKFKDYEAITTVYIKTAIHQSENLHLKLKAINSYHSLLMGENKYYCHQSQSSKLMLQQLIHASSQKQYHEIRRAALLCFIFILRSRGSELVLRQLTISAQNQLYQLKLENEELAALLDALLKQNTEEQILSEMENNAPSPKFISIQQTEELKTKNIEHMVEIVERIPDNTQIKIFNEVSYAEQFLKKLEKSGSWQFEEIQEFAPFLEKCLIDESIKLFSISKKIVEVIFNCDGGKKKQYYVVLVPCIVNGIGNKRFIVRKNLDKLVRQYVKNHTEVWIKNFLERFAATRNAKVKEILIDLLMHAYRTSPEFYYPTDKTFEIFDAEINDNSSHLKRKVIDCIVLILEKQGKDEKSRDELLQIFSADPYQKIIRKMGKTNNSIESYSEEGDNQIMEPVSPINFRKERKNRLITAEPEKITSIEKSEEKDKSCENVSQGKYKNNNRQIIQPKEKKVRNSQIQITFKLKKNERKSKEQKSSVERLPQLRKVKNSSISKHEINESPVKRSLGEKNIIYTERQQLKNLESPKSELEKALIDIKDNNWNIQFDAINKIRSIVEFQKDLIHDDSIYQIVNQLLNSLNNLRSGVTKLALMCLGEMMRKFHKKMYQFTQNIVLTVMKKSITTSQFMQDQIKKIIVTAAEELCVSKIIIALNSMKDSKSTEIKITFLLFVEVLIKNQKVFKKQFEWIWAILLDFHEQPQFTLRNECKRLVKYILETYKDWKTDVLQLKKMYLDKMDKMLKNLNSKGQNLWIEIQNQQFEKALLSKVMTAKYFSASFNKFEELDKSFTLKKSWKERIKLLNDVFQSAFDHPMEFESNSNAKKYMGIACDQIDEKNPGLLLNSLNNLIKSVDTFPNLLEECLGIILQRCLLVIETRRIELVTIANKMINKIYSKYDLNKVIKEYLRILTNAKLNKLEVMNQMVFLLKENEQKQGEHRSIREISLDSNILHQNTHALLNHNSQNLLIKSFIKLCSDKNVENSQSISGKFKELFNICQRRFGQEFTNKMMANDKVVELLS